MSNDQHRPLNLDFDVLQQSVIFGGPSTADTLTYLAVHLPTIQSLPATALAEYRAVADAKFLADALHLEHSVTISFP
ncbi:hypothetical protein AMAG_18935 [Allomyces macrogynus ATCC 38327]|uniref:Uncharacterized protein n=1 Tax=Allomyces macrogynus (strain ATCC 38327) TaxID=578462 RepID=A0A0L0SKD4_ALLM3|nr:hypothetical protein AMAG_18935 [Allomyces macrogynus ATCC 38327]|eukprot:KNE62956.1 hypothetical protein AMAG_18935 [Allomyces macrogynus ATCC 38327]